MIVLIIAMLPTANLLDFVAAKAADTSPIPTPTDENSFTEIVRSMKGDAEKMAWVAALDSKKIKIDQYDDAMILSKTIDVANALEISTTYRNEYKNTNKIPQKLLEELGVASDINKIDLRIVDSLINLVTPKSMGGAGRDFIEVGTITRGYSSKATEDASKESDKNQIEKDTIEAIKHFKSAHAKDLGQAADITAVDNLLGTKFSYDETGALVDKTKLDPVPIQVGWQTDKGAGSIKDVPSQIGQSVDKVANNTFSQIFNSTMNGLLSEQGIDIADMGNLGTNLANIVQNLGSQWYKQNMELPANTQLGSDLSSQGKNMGQAILSKMTNGTIPTAGLEGNNTTEMKINAGREIVAQKMGLPAYSFTNGGSDSKQLLTNIGQRYMEDALDLSPGSLRDATSANITEKIGTGFIEHQLGLNPGGFSGNTADTIKNAIGAAKYQEILDYPEYIDGLLYVDIGTTKNGLSNISDFKKKVGQRVIEKKILVYEKGSDGSNKRDEAFGVFDSDHAGLIDRFISGDKDVFYDIGVSVAAKNLSVNSDEQKLIRSWFRTGKIETDPDKNNIEKLDEEGLSQKLNLQKYDLWRMFVYNQANLVFERVGWGAWLSALTPANDSNANSQVDNPNVGDNFFRARFTDIKNDATKINNSSSNSTVKQLATDIFNLAQEMETYGKAPAKIDASNIDAVKKALLYPFAEKTKESIALITGKLSEIEKIEQNASTTDLRKKSFEIIEKRGLKDFNQISEADITGLNRSYYVEPTYQADLVKVLKGKESLNTFNQSLGLVQWGTVAGLDNPSDLNRVWASIAANPTKNPEDILKSIISNSQLQNIADQFNDGFGLAPWGSSSDYYKVSTGDVIKYLLGSTTPIISKLGSFAYDQAMHFSQGYGSKEIILGLTDFATASKYAGLNLFSEQTLGLMGKVSTVGNVIDNLSRLFLSENLGLPQAFGNDFNNFVQSAENQVRILRAYGIQLPDSLKNSTDWTAILNWAKQSQPWNEQTGNIKAQIGYLNLPLDQVKSFLSNIVNGTVSSAQNIFNGFTNNVKSIISGYLNLDQFNDGMGLVEALKNKGIGYLQFVQDQIDQLKGSFDKGNTEKFLGWLALAATNWIMTNSNLPSDSGAVGSPKSSADLAAISTMLATIIGGKGNDSKAVKDAFISAGIIMVANHYPQALDIAGKALVGLQFVKTFLGAFTQGERDQTSVEMVNNVADNLTQEIPASSTDPTLVHGALNRFYTDGNVGVYTQAIVLSDSLKNFFAAKKDNPSLDIVDYFKNLPVPNFREAWNAIDGLDADHKSEAWKAVETAGITNVVEIAEYQKEQYQQKLRQAQSDIYTTQILTMVLNTQLMKQGIPPIAGVMLRGTDTEKTEALRQTAIYYLLSGSNLPGWSVATIDMLTRSLINHEQISSAQLGPVLDMALGQMLHLDYIPAGLGAGFADYILKGDSARLMTSLKDGAILYGTTFLDKTLGMPSGTTYQMYSMWKTYQTTLTAYHTALTTELNSLTTVNDFIAAHGGLSPDLINNPELQGLNDKYLASATAKDAAMKSLQMNSANIANIVVQMIFGETFGKLDQQLGLPSGTISLIASAIIYSTIGGLTLAATAALLWPVAAMMLLGSLFGGHGGIFGSIFGGGGSQEHRITKIEVVYSACGYYPGFGSAPTDIESGCPAEFHGETKELFMAGAMQAANYVVQNRLLPNLLTLGTRMKDEKMTPNRIETLKTEHVDFNSALSDIAYGNGSTGSGAKLIISGSRRGFSWNEQLWDRVHYNY